MDTLNTLGLGLHGTSTVIGNKEWKIPATDFIISPLNGNGTLHIKSIVNGVTQDVAIEDLEAGKYTKVTGAVPYTEFYVSTSETFYIKW